MKNIFDEECTVGVHNGIFHADDVSSMVVLTTLNPTIKYCRTRDLDILNSLDCVIDVGDVYDPSIQRFDHHGKTFNERYKRQHQISSQLLYACRMEFPVLSSPFESLSNQVVEAPVPKEFLKLI